MKRFRRGARPLFKQKILQMDSLGGEWLKFLKINEIAKIFRYFTFGNFKNLKAFVTSLGRSINYLEGDSS